MNDIVLEYSIDAANLMSNAIWKELAVFIAFVSNVFLAKLVFCPFSANVFLSTLDKPVYKSAMHAGNCTVWNMVSNPMDRCLVTKQLEVVMTPSIHSSLKLKQANMSPEQSL